MSDVIPELPEIPGPLRTAATIGKVVPFIGAGVSCLAGCPGWVDFAERALRRCVDLKLLTHGECDQLKDLSPRTKLSIFNQLVGSKRELVSLLQAKDEAKGDRVYGALSKLSRRFVTTNYDDWLDRPLPMSATSASAAPEVRRKMFSGPEFYSNDLLKDDCVFHIHGSVSDPPRMVVTTSDYLSRYKGHRVSGPRTDENTFLNFLEQLFNSNNVLFVGYGLGELEILEYVLEKASHRGTRGEPRHYLIEGFFSHQIALKKRLETYFGEFGIGLLAYSREAHGYDQLIDLIEHFAKEIPAQPRLKLEDLSDMERLLE